MKVIVGLGNPGREYAATRHNLGFMVVDALAKSVSIEGGKLRFRADILEGLYHGSKLVLVKPQTYMNLSGHSVREVMQWYKVPLPDLLVVLDDLDLPFGTLRLRADGSAGGHNGLDHIIEQLGTRNVARLRIGIGRGGAAATAQVLSRFSADEERALPGVVDDALACCAHWLDDGVISAMNRCNRRPTPAPSKTEGEAAAAPQGVPAAKVAATGV